MINIWLNTIKVSSYAMKCPEPDRRIKQDIWIYIARGLATAGWLLFIFAFIMSYYAAPEANYGMYRYHNIEVRQFWLTPLTGYLYLILWFSALSSYACLLIDRYRSRRKTDSKHFNLILLLLISVAWISYILIKITP